MTTKPRYHPAPHSGRFFTTWTGWVVSGLFIGNQVMAKHGMYNTPEYSAWRKIKHRCYNRNSQRWDRYGGRGIAVCERWKSSFLAFYEDMGPRPSPEHSIERIDNDGNYEPNNCKWATKAEQNCNRSDNVLLTFDNVTLTLSGWARRIGIGVKTLSCRLSSGWTLEDTLTRKVEPRPWNESDISTWKRKRRSVPLSKHAMTVLLYLSSREAMCAKHIDVDLTPDNKHKALRSLIIRGYVVRTPYGIRRWIYSTTSLGLEIYEAIQREENKDE